MTTQNDWAEAKLLARTPLGAHWISRSSHGSTANERFVFSQDPQGRIKLASGVGGISSTALEAWEAPFNNQFAVLGWGWQAADSRLYYITRFGDLKERTTAGRGGPPDGARWRSGRIGGIKTATYSNVAACRYLFDQNTAMSVVCYQKADSDEIHGVYTVDENSWSSINATLPAGIRGTSIAMTRRGDTIKILYQLPDTKIVAYEGTASREGGVTEWKKVNFESHWDYNPGASIAAVGDRTFTITAENKLSVHGPDGYQNTHGSVIPLAPLAAIGYPETGGAVMSVYTQRTGHRISELVFDNEGKMTERASGVPQ